jgi:hypothetical protein
MLNCFLTGAIINHQSPLRRQDAKKEPVATLRDFHGLSWRLCVKKDKKLIS